MAGGQHGGSVRAILYALCANLGIAIAKSVAAWFTGSGSMLAEAIHSFADTANQVLLFIGLKQAQRPADDEHPLGYGKSSYFFSFVVALLLFSMGGVFSIYEGWHKLSHPEPLSHAWVAVLVLVLGILLEGASLMGCLNEIKKLRGERSLWHWLKHTRSAELVVVLGEDLGAQLGLMLALVFVALAWLTGNPDYDALGSISIGVVLIAISIFLGIRMYSLLVGRSADPDLDSLIDDLIGADDSIVEVFNTITVRLGPDVMLAAKVRMQAGLSCNAAVDCINSLERRIKQALPEVRWIFMEPDVAD
ncbi:MAG: cation diffusion facilitator family transporter [Gammaproteobacteria bacterium]|nr:cation diffusion facilitator family transporter [Gammaproteobacteria bacterium]